MPVGLRLVEVFSALHRVGELRRRGAARERRVLEDRRVQHRLHERRRIGNQSLAADEARRAVGVSQIDDHGHDRRVDRRGGAELRRIADGVEIPFAFRIPVGVEPVGEIVSIEVDQRVDVWNAEPCMRLAVLVPVRRHFGALGTGGLEIGGGRQLIRLLCGSQAGEPERSGEIHGSGCGRDTSAKHGEPPLVGR